MAEYEFNIRDYWIPIWKRKFIILLIVIVVSCISLFYINRLPYIYRATVTIRIKEQRSLSSVFSQFVTGTITDPLASYTRVLQSQHILEKVVLESGLADEFASQSEIAAKARQLQGQISANVVEGTNIIKIDALHGNPETAAKIANTVAEVFIIENLREKNKQARHVREFIENQLVDVTEKLDDSEVRLKEFKEREAPSGIALSLQDRLLRLETKKAELLRQYTELHPETASINEEIDILKEQLKNLPEKELEFSRLTREVTLNIDLYTTLKTKLASARIAEAEHVEDVSIVNPAVRAGAPVSPNKKIALIFGVLSGLTLALVMVFIVESLDTSIGTIDEVENITKLPVLGVLPSMQHSDTEEKNIFKMTFNRLFHISCKQTEKEKIYLRLAVYYEPKSSTAEAYRTIRTNLKLGPSLKTILVTSACPKEGKTTVVTNLGLVIALSGERTLLVSSDLRRPEIATTFGLDRKPGLSEVVTKTNNLDEGIRDIADIMLGDIKFDKIMKTPDIENISLLPSGQPPGNPAELLESREMQDIINELKMRFDVIIFDSPPVLPITDASLLASKVDGVVLVYEAGRTARSAFLRAKAQLESSGAKIMGVVLNHIKAQVDYAGYPYYYYKYKYYYGEKSGEGHKKTG